MTIKFIYKSQVARPRFPSLGVRCSHFSYRLFQENKIYSIYQQYTQIFQVKANLIQEWVHIKPLQRGGRGKENGGTEKDPGSSYLTKIGAAGSFSVRILARTLEAQGLIAIISYLKAGWG